MRLKKEKLRNFARFTDFEVEFDKQVTHLVGLNGAGKSTVGLTAIWAGLKGIAEKNSTGQLIGERFRFIGKAGASADIELTLHDEEKKVDILVKNHITAQTNQITFQAPEGYVTDPLWLNNLLNVSFLSAKNFASLTPKEQALTLGIDVSEFDKKIDAKKLERKVENRKLEDYKGLQGEMTRVDEVSLEELEKIRLALDERRRSDEKLFDTRSYYINLLKKLNDEYQRSIEGVPEGHQSNEIRLSYDTNETIRIVPQFHDTLIKTMNQMIIPNLPGMDKTLNADVQAYSEKVKSVDETNRKAKEYKTWLEKVSAKAKIATAITKLDAEIDKLQKERLAHIKKTNMGFEGLTIDEEGGLLFDEGNGPRPIKDPYYSKGQLEIIVAKLYAATNPTLRVRFIDDFDSLDDDSKEKILKFLFDEGFQVITSSVGKVAKNENSIILRECKIKDYTIKEQNNLLT
jgi:DNA repair exonuclease SbcCD ATPase subunit